MRTWMLTALAVLCLSLTCGEAVADGDGTASEKALASGLDALKVRIEASMKRAALLEKMGRDAEALALYEKIETMYADGLVALKKLVRGSGKADAPFKGPANAGVIGKGQSAGAPFGGRAKRKGGGKISGMDMAGQRRRVQAAINESLVWLASQQREDGSWNAAKAEHRVGATGLALLTFLGAGYTHATPSDYKSVVAKGLDFLRSSQDPEGCFSSRRSPHYNYDHAMATLAVVEAYGMTRSPLLLEPAQKGLDFTAMARNPYMGWRYGVKPGDNDTSITHWMLAGIYSAKMVNDGANASGKASPFTIDEDAFNGALAWVDKMTDSDYGRVGYITRGSGPARARDRLDQFPGELSESMTAAGINIRLMAGQDAAAKGVIRKGLDVMSKLPPVWKETGGTIDMYYWYIGTQVAAKVGGRHWNEWRDALVDALIPNQSAGPKAMKGSWPAIGPWADYGGPVVSTAWMALCLNSVNRSFAATK